MLVFLNGQFVPHEQAVVSAFDRGFRYGDGLFETLRVYGGQPFAWEEHLQRLSRGAGFLKIELPFTVPQMRSFADELIAANRLPDSVLRLQLTRGGGPRGYSPRDAGPPTLVMSLHAAPALAGHGATPWRVVTTSFRVAPDDPLTGLKTCNRLKHVLARAEADARNADEGLLLTPAGHVAQGSASNVFWIERDTVVTPPLATGVLPGVTRATVLELCGRLGLAAREATRPPEALAGVDGIFLTLSTWGIVEVARLDDRDVRRSPLTQTLREAYAKLTRR